MPCDVLRLISMATLFAGAVLNVTVVPAAFKVKAVVATIILAFVCILKFYQLDFVSTTVILTM